jgi:hypothetical protein
MESLPDWAYSSSRLLLGSVSPGLALLMAGPVGRFLRRVLFVRGHGGALVTTRARGSTDEADDRSRPRSSLMGTLASPFQISVSIRPETHAMLATSGGRCRASATKPVAVLIQA